MGEQKTQETNRLPPKPSRGVLLPIFWRASKLLTTLKRVSMFEYSKRRPKWQQSQLLYKVLA